MIGTGDLKNTLRETVGVGWGTARMLLALVWIASIFVYGIISTSVGFWMAIGASLSLTFITGREYFIANLYRIRNISGLRERLLYYGDGEFILQDIKREQIWRGEEVNPEIEQHLERLAKEKAELTDRIMKAAADLFAPPEDKASN